MYYLLPSDLGRDFGTGLPPLKDEDHGMPGKVWAKVNKNTMKFYAVLIFF